MANEIKATDHVKREKRKPKRSRPLRITLGILWVIAIVAYFAVSFIFDLWSFSWLIIVAAAVLANGISLGFALCGKKYPVEDK